MKLANAIEGGLSGASTLALLQEALRKIDHTAPRPLLHQSGLLRKLKKRAGKSGPKTTKLYVQLATELLSNAALFGLSGLGKKRNAVLRGTLLGTAVGLGAAFLQNEKEKGHGDEVYAADGTLKATEANDLKKKLLTVALYTSGGLLAGLAVKKMSGKKGKKKMKRWGQQLNFA